MTVNNPVSPWGNINGGTAPPSIETFSTVAALRANTAQIITPVWVDGLTTDGDGCADFFYPTLDTVSADNGLTIIVDTLGVRWYRNASMVKFVNNTSIVYSPNITPDLSKGAHVLINVTDGNPFTINAPINSIKGQEWLLVLENSSGGVLGAITYNAVFHFPTNNPPSAGDRRYTRMYFDGTFHWFTANLNNIAG